MEIRTALLEDKKQVFILAKSLATSFEVHEDEFNIIYKEHCSNEDSTLLVAVSNNQIVGYCLAFHHKAFYANGLITWVEELMVSEKFRGQSIGSKLMDEIEKYTKDRGSKLVALATRRASEFYLKNNYEESAIYYRKLL